MKDIIISKYFNQPVILDTGILMFLLMGTVHSASSNSTVIWQGRTKSEWNFLYKFVMNFKGILITPHILAELTNLLHKHTGNDIKKYKYLLSNMVSDLEKYEEKYIEKNIILKYPKFSEFGTADIGIIECGKITGSLIVVEDLNLKLYCEGLKIPCVNFNNLKYFSW